MSGTCEKPRDVSAELLKPLQEIFDLLGDSLAETITQRMAGALPDFESQGKKTSYEMAAIKDQISAMAVNRELLENANLTNRLLGDQFYQERIIGPMVRGVLPIVDLVWDALGRPGSDRQCLSALLAQLEQFLAGYGIEAFSCEACEPFDPKIMKPLQATSTSELELNGLVAGSLQCGFATPERILRLETVSLYKFETLSTIAITHSERNQS